MKEVIHVLPSLFVPLEGYSRPEGRQVFCSRPVVTCQKPHRRPLALAIIWSCTGVLFICAVNGATQGLGELFRVK